MSRSHSMTRRMRRHGASCAGNHGPCPMLVSMRGQTGRDQTDQTRPDRGAVDRGRDETDSICCLHGVIAKRPALAEDSTDVAMYDYSRYMDCRRSIYFSVAAYCILNSECARGKQRIALPLKQSETRNCLWGACVHSACLLMHISSHWRCG